MVRQFCWDWCWYMLRSHRVLFHWDIFLWTLVSKGVPFTLTPKMDVLGFVMITVKFF
eukprot:NODE_8314_length_292_cov_27.950617_g7574_i0.p1 GENE.NODE_8314_length_292_cov_27.950617_g7574_i0~~NODE_8314_length_292_cov_27.950617_g7574_i0.p1  ORF type:complete len:57 (-),score=1.21 NODE_8314_length_292_cov_27.950617_g7574_i0:28-198(-)